ncbi:hypothetical protein RJD24_19825 [Bacillaceae bacterium IKA-2]|nr:hypothetical protein RJD24_19825 [Bacillaceae bacterium IKA-2]
MKRKIFFSLLIGFLLMVIIFVVAIGPQEKIEATTMSNQQLGNHFWSSLEDLSFELSEQGMTIEHTLESEDLNNIIQLSQKNDTEFTALNGSFEGDKIKIIANKKIFRFIPTQYILYLSPSAKDGRMTLRLEGASMGRIPISKGLITPSLKELESDVFVIDKDDPTSIVLVGTPRSFLFEEIQVEEDKLFIEFRVQINSLKDLIELGEFMMPQQLLETIKSGV